MRLVLASTNQGKLREVRRLLGSLGFTVVSLAEAGLDPRLELPETGDSFEHNALEKTRALQEMLGGWVLGDDSGLEVDALGGAPGVRSARYAGVELPGRERDLANVRLLLRELEGVEPERRTARFVCVVALVRPDGQSLLARGTCEGRIIEVPRGESGFGYDPVFLPRGRRRTMAELSMDEKNAISHRGRALRKLARRLRERGWVVGDGARPD
ncbi:MAG: non-canonical purine NTP pyrophosphatase, RdgB/HAM1 family [Deltaproteobacteria bacterium]|nr:MAG: non-canonical purine NTP pyrophosphatase, RdgB/HAM1 family [Deltaproteobacteria bacterium]